MSPVTLAWLLPAAIAGDAVNGTRQSIWDAHIFIDTPELRLVWKQSIRVKAIAYNLREMFRLDVPIICTVIGEGGSGGLGYCGRTPVDV